MTCAAAVTYRGRRVPGNSRCGITPGRTTITSEPKRFSYPGRTIIRRQWIVSYARLRLMPLLFFMLPFTDLARGQTREAVIVHDASMILDGIMSIPGRRIPQAMLSDAQAVAIIPGVLKGSFVVGIRHGRGVVVTRDVSGVWQLPVFVTLTGGSVGWQVGVHATDVILVFKSQDSVADLLRGKFTIGADVAAAAGPVGRNVAAATDAKLRAKIYSYSRSRGLFAGASIDGSTIQTDLYANQRFYGAPLVEASGKFTHQPQNVPVTAQQLVHKIRSYTQVSQVGLAPRNNTIERGSGELAADKSKDLRGSLANASLQLNALLDVPWQRFLALPAELYHDFHSPRPESLQLSLRRFEQVANDRSYQKLTTRPEFQRVHTLLRQYLESQVWKDSNRLPSLPVEPRSP